MKKGNPGVALGAELTVSQQLTLGARTKAGAALEDGSWLATRVTFTQH